MVLKTNLVSKKLPKCVSTCEPRRENRTFAYAKTKAQISCAVTAQLISTFVFATRIAQPLFFLNPKFQASSSFLCLYSLVCVGPVRKPHCWFSHEVAHNLHVCALVVEASVV